MLRLLAALLVTLAALAPPSGVAASDGEGDLPPPPGSAADVALWRAGRAAGEAIVVERARSGTLQARVRSGRLLERLDQAAARAGHEAREDLTRLRARLLEAWQRNHAMLTRPWPVDPTRGCGYPILNFDSALRAGAAAEAGELAAARAALRECLDRAQRAVRPLAEANRLLEAAWVEADRALGPPAGSPAGSPLVERSAQHEERDHLRHERGER